MSSWGNLSPLRETLGLSGSVMYLLGQLEVTSDLSGTIGVNMNMKLFVSETNFVSQISQPNVFVQQWFCIQNLRMDLSVQQKQTVRESVFWFLRY